MAEELFLLPEGLGNTRQNSDRDVFVRYICLLEGYKTRFKNLHWSAPNMPIHLKLDKFLDKLSDYQDAMAEQSQGQFGQFDPNEINATQLSFRSALEAIASLNDDVIAFHQRYKDSTRWIGIINGTEDFLETILEYIYLFKICMRGQN